MDTLKGLDQKKKMWPSSKTEFGLKSCRRSYIALDVDLFDLLRSYIPLIVYIWNMKNEISRLNREYLQEQCQRHYLAVAW